MTPLRIGMVGAQFAAHLHLENYSPLRGSKVEITAVASRAKGRAEELARKYNIAYVANDYRALLDRKDVDALGQHTRMEPFQKEPQKWIVDKWEDVEDWATMIMNFEDGSQAVVSASDGVLGGVRNTMTVYLSNAVVQVNINPSDTVFAYAPAPHIFGDEYIAEKLETKAGWNFASPDEDWVRGYPQELADFADCLVTGREPVSGLDLAVETVKAIYSAYLSAEEGVRVELDKNCI